MTQHKNAAFPITAFDNLNERRPAKLGISDHHHDACELFMLHQGQVLIILDGTSHYLESDQCICILPGTVHCVRSVSGHPFFYSTVQFRLDHLMADASGLQASCYYQRLMDHSYPAETVIRKDTDSGLQMIDLYQKLILLLKTRPYGYEIGARGYLELILFQIYQSGPKTERAVANTKDLQMVYEFIDSNYMNNITVDTLAMLSNMSKYYFIRYFRKATGQTPVEYVNYVRIQKACEFLKEQDMKILDIAMAVGIQDLSYFNRMFKKIIGVTPTKYRMQLQQQRTEQRALYYEEEKEDIPFYSYTY